ncbi:sensor histidine kinase [Yoonia sp. 208BN28-4]|uniref:sensor histidine kinase n=1 Tax=Yoonia sp. 208BN28-4 TaxID=3126505 RepID=UPI0030975B15
MGRAVRSKEWTAHPLGHPEGWPQELKTMLRIMLTSQQPTEILWGDQLYCFYNDAFAGLFELDRNLDQVGQEGRVLWADAWETVGDKLETVMTSGEAYTSEDALIPIMVDGVWEDRHWMYSYSPILDEDYGDGALGIFVTCQDRTKSIQLGKAETKAREAAQNALLETHHRVKNNLAVLKGIVRSESRKTDDETLRQSLGRLGGRIDSVMRLYEAMLSQSNNDGVDACSYVERLSRDIHDLMASDYKEIELQLSCDQVALEVEQIVHVGVIVVELLTNAHKHAFIGYKTGTIYVSLQLENKTVSLTVRDEHPDTSVTENTAEKSTGIGKVVMEAAVDQLNGQFVSAETDQGRSIKVTFPHTGQ